LGKKGAAPHKGGVGEKNLGFKNREKKEKQISSSNEWEIQLEEERRFDKVAGGGGL